MKGPAKGTQIKGGRYYRVRADGAKRVWLPLTKVREGLPAFYTALADSLGRDSRDDTMPKLVAEWQREVMVKHSAKTQIDEKRRATVIADSFKTLGAAEVETPDCYDFLKPFQSMPRTHDLFRSQLRSIFQLAELKGYRKAGSNPVSAIPTMGSTPRDRYITDSELRRVKIGGLYGANGRRTPTGITLACFLEVAFLTGADVGVLLRLREERDQENPDEPHVCADGIFVRRDKTERTSRPVIVEWTPRLRAVVAKLKAIKAAQQTKKRAQQRVVTPLLFIGMDGTPWTYEALSSAWQKARARAKLPPTMLRDLRAKAATDKEEKDGITGANVLLDHTTEQQTADYIRRKKARRTSAAA
ncbi:integrase [Roseateles chitosanitabidus]|uniref:integrase n=1 Tax=Roseateles chitosanitabidus TaxID=65048 RepID=UPI0011DF3818|nr:integrase [Roseateles chitosanitabidus]